MNPLTNYIRQQLQRGYGLNSIKRYLEAYGYQEHQIEAAINEVYGRRLSEGFSINPKIMIGAATGIIAIVLAAAIIFFWPSGSSANSFELSISTDKAAFTQGELVQLSLALEGIKGSADVKTELIRLPKNEIVLARTKTLFTGNELETVFIPEDAEPGNYLLRSIASSEGKRSVKTLNLAVGKKQEAIDSASKPPETQGLDNIDEMPQDTGQTPETIEAPVVTPPSGSLSNLNSFEIIEKVKSIAKASKQEAAGMCAALELEATKNVCYSAVGEEAGDRSYCILITEERAKDVCFSNVARILQKSEICNDVIKESRRDSCYINFATPPLNDYTVCDRIINQYLKQSCNSLKQLSALNQTNLAFFQSLLNQTVVSLNFE
ncbi:hypothetical protein J4212_02715 [Candidatus Woesearchaeota archaeon]|nr:hypothetical protein [Candidatus Woesearchaeota archaeon]